MVLNSTEQWILQLLMEHPGTVLFHLRILEAIWEAPFVGDDAAVARRLSNLRTLPGA